MRVLVTGGAGYIGSVIVEKLLERSWTPIIYDNLSTGFKEAVPEGATFVFGDVLDEQLLKRVCKDKKVDAIIHLAAKLIVPESLQNPLLYYETNILGTLQVLKVCRELQIRKLVFSSTAAVYGQPKTLPLKEDFPLNPITPYGSSKAMAEKVIQDCAPLQNLNYVILRYFNVAGAMMNMKQGQRGQHHHLVAAALKTAFAEQDRLNIYGRDFSTKDGSAIRDFIHVEDLAEAHILALNYLEDTQKSQILNCGYGHGYTVLEIIACLEAILEKEIPKSWEAPREGDCVEVYADSQKIRHILNWNPRHLDLRPMLESSVQWMRQLNRHKK